MKTRTDFVTNSSSSSFIVGFQDAEGYKTLKKELASILGNSRKANKYYQYIVHNWDEINGDSAIDLFEENREYIEDLVGYEIEDYLRANGCDTWYLHTEEFNTKLNDKMVFRFYCPQCGITGNTLDDKEEALKDWNEINSIFKGAC